MAQSGITATPIMVRSTLGKIPNLQRVVMKTSSPTMRDRGRLRAQVFRAISRLVPVAVRSPLTQPGAPHAGPTTNSSAAAAPDGAAPAAQPSHGHAQNETQRRSAEGLIQHGSPGIGGCIGAEENSGIGHSPFELRPPEAAAEILGQA